LAKTYYWKVRGSNTTGNSPWSTTWSFSTQTIVAPTLISPSNNSTNQNLNLTFDWSDIGYVTNYIFQISTNNLFTNAVEQSITSSGTTISDLSFNTQYFWRVKVNVSGNFSEWSNVSSFTTQNILSINETNQEIKLYPNPANNYLIIDSKSFINQNYEIIDISGKILIKNKILNNKQEIDLTNLKTGIYFIKINKNSYKISVIK